MSNFLQISQTKSKMYKYYCKFILGFNTFWKAELDSLFYFAKKIDVGEHMVEKVKKKLHAITVIPPYIG